LSLCRPTDSAYIAYLLDLTAAKQIRTQEANLEDSIGIAADSDFKRLYGTSHGRQNTAQRFGYVVLSREPHQNSVVRQLFVGLRPQFPDTEILKLVVWFQGAYSSLGTPRKDFRAVVREHDTCGGS